MTFRIPTHPELRALLVAQDGVVSRAQLVDVGLPGSTVAHLTRDWPSPVSGVYVAQVGRDLTFRQLCWAGVLGAGPSARLCRDAAAYLAGLLDEEPEVVHVLTPWSVCQSRRDRRIVFVRERPGIRGPSTRSDLPRTGIDDTVIDLCDRSTAREVLGHLARACQRRLTTAERLLERMRGRRRVKHRGLMKDVLLDVAGGAVVVDEVDGGTVDDEPESAIRSPPRNTTTPSIDASCFRTARLPWSTRAAATVRACRSAPAG